MREKRNTSVTMKRIEMNNQQTRGLNKFFAKQKVKEKG